MRELRKENVSRHSAPANMTAPIRQPAYVLCGHITDFSLFCEGPSVGMGAMVLSIHFRRAHELALWRMS